MSNVRRREPLTRERVLRAALALVDAEGLEAVSMRRVGEALGVEAMSLYNHVASKAALLDGIFELVLGELPPARPKPDWASMLRERGRALRAVLRAHPNALPVFATRPAVTPASLAHVEAALEVLRGAGLSVGEALTALQVVVAYVVGHTLQTHGPSRPDEAAAPSYERLDPASHPRVREAARALARHDAEREFEAGLEALVVGLERAHHRRDR